MLERKQVLKNSAEEDFVYDRGRYCYLVNSCRAKRKIKSDLNRRYRRELKAYLRADVAELEREFM